MFRLVALTCSRVPVRAARTATLAAFVGAIGALPALAANDPPFVDDRIDAALTACLRAPATKTTLDINGCYQTAGDAYEHALSRTYVSALAHLDPASRTLVRRSQDAWRAARNRERDAWRGPWRNDRGTIVGSEIGESNVRALRERIIELLLYWPGYSGETPVKIDAR